MKTKINELEKIALVNQLAYQAAIQDQQTFEGTLPNVLTEAAIVFPQKEKNAASAKPLQKRKKLAEGLQELVYNVYQGKKDLTNHVDKWIKFVALCTDAKNHMGSEEYLDLPFFLFTLKDTLQTQKKHSGLANELLKFIDGTYGRKHLIKEIEKWIRFVALCTGKEHHTESEEYMALLNFFFGLKEALEMSKSVSNSKSGRECDGRIGRFIADTMIFTSCRPGFPENQNIYRDLSLSSS